MNAIVETPSTPKDTLWFWSFGRQGFHEHGYPGLLMDYNCELGFIKESMEGSSDCVQFELAADTLFHTGITIEQAAQVLVEEIDILVERLNTLLIVPAPLIGNAKAIINAMVARYRDTKYDAETEGLEIGLKFESVTCQEGPFETGFELSVSISRSNYEKDNVTLEEQPLGVFAWLPAGK